VHSPSEPSWLVEFDELDHQALDLLDGLGCGAVWLTARSQPGPETSAKLERALAEEDESSERVTEAVARVRPLLIGLVGRVAGVVVDAAARLATTDDRGGLEPAAVAALAERLAAQPERGAGIEWATELTLEVLGLARDSIASAIILALPQELPASEHVDEHGETVAAIGERLERARNRNLRVELRVFRSAALRMAGPSLRAAALATERPDAIALALKIVTVHADPREQVEQFDRALAATNTAKDEPLATFDGPKRKFTIVHVILAAIVLGLTLWHYIWR
jgi:hypothetical protein